MNRNEDIKIIFVDIDNTILYHHNQHHDFDKKSLKALNKIQSKYGVKVVIATARPYDSAKETGVFNYINPDAVVCCNGTNAMVGDKIIYSDAFPKELVRNVVDTCNALDIVVEVSTPWNRYFTMDPNKYVGEYFKVFSETVPMVKKEFDDEDVNALLIFAPVELDDKLKEMLDKSIDGFRFDAHGIDVRTHNVSKKDGMSVILQYYGFTQEQAMSIGDSRGDLPMFEVSKFAVAMGNGHDELKEKAYFVTKHIKNHGVKYALKKFKVI